MVKQTQKSPKRPTKLYIIVAICIVAALGLGVFIGSKYLHPTHKTPKAAKALQSTDAGFRVATGDDKKQATQQIKDAFRVESTTKCGADVKQSDRAKVFDQYLKVNKYANRAVIRGCSDVDALLAKNPFTDKWERTSVNVSLDLRANPVWRDECLASDILRADTQVRAENSSIDATDLVACRVLKERDQIVYLQRKVGQKPTQKDVDDMIKSAQDFVNMAGQSTASQ